MSSRQATKTVVVAVAVSSRGSAAAGAAGGGRLTGAGASTRLFAGIAQRGISLGRRDAPVRLVEFADLQCPYCDQYARRALPTLVTDFVRPGMTAGPFAAAIRQVLRAPR